MMAGFPAGLSAIRGTTNRALDSLRIRSSIAFPSSVPTRSASRSRGVRNSYNSYRPAPSPVEEGPLRAVEVSSPSRLHLSLLDLNGELGRVDGGIGIALREPRLHLVAERTPGLSVTGPGKDLVSSYAQRFCAQHGIDGAKLTIKASIPRHVGLGSGTQAALVAGSALARLNGLERTPRQVAHDLGRGGTSGIGVAAFDRGGFIVDGGHSFGPGHEKERFLPSSASRADPPPVLMRIAFPSSWRFVVVVPHTAPGIHGDIERAAFAERCPVPRDAVESLCRLVLMKLLPAVVERDISVFGEAVTALRHEGFGRVGADLAPPRSIELVEHLLREGAAGAGISSFGPAVYGIVEGARGARQLHDSVMPHLTKGSKAFITQADNRGARIRPVH